MGAAKGNSTRRRYLLKRNLGTGAMGTVFQTWDRLMGQDVAFKQVKANPLNNKIDSMASRLALAHEFQVLASLKHPNVIGVLDYGFDEDKQPYFTMSYLENPRNIRKAAEGKPLRERLRLLAQLLHALVYLHRHGVVHRDLKPDNVLVTKKGEVKVLDFGLALLANKDHMDEVVGTLAYMAPEILSGEPPTVLSDLYAVGMIAYELFAEQEVFPIGSTRQLVQDILDKEPDFTAIERIDFSDLTSVPHIRAAIMDTDMPTEVGTLTALLQTDVPLPLPSQPLPRPASRPVQDFRMNPNLNRTDVEIEQTDIFAEDPMPLVTILRRLLAKRPYMRYQSAQQVLDDLERAFKQTFIEEAVVRESFLQAAKFVGRGTEISQLSAALDGAINSQGSIWLVGGESGVGKSRLLDEIRTYGMVKGMLVLRGQAVNEGAVLFQLWREPLRRLILNVDVSDADASVLKQVVPDIARLLGREVADPPVLERSAIQQRLVDAIADLFRAHFEAYPDAIMIALEDLQWASAESLDILKGLMPLIGTSPLVIIGDYRDDEAFDLPVRLPGCERIKLQRLDKASIAELCASMLGEAGSDPYIVDTLLRETEGNIFFLVEVVRALAEEVGDLQKINTRALPARILSGGIARIIQRRLDQVPEYYRPLMQVAAIAGRQIDLPLLQTIYPLMNMDEWLTVCVHAAVIVVQDEKWQFAHDKLREHLLGNLPFDQAQELHRLVAENMERLYENSLSDHAAALAYHWRYAGDSRKELHYTLLAGEHAYEISAFREAKPYYERALMLTAAEDGRKIHINTRLGSVHEHLSEYETAVQYIQSALTMAEITGDERRAAAALFNFGWINLRRGRLEETAQNVRQALSIARKTQDERTLMESLSLQGVVNVVKGEPAEAEKHLTEALELARRLNDPMNQGSILNSLGAAAEAQNQHEVAQRYLLESRRIAEQIGHRILAANIGGNLGRLSYHQCHYAEAQGHFDKALILFQQAGSVFGEAIVSYYLGLIALQLQHQEEGRRHFYTALRLSTKIGAVAITLLAMCGVAKLLAGTGKGELAAALLTMISNHPASQNDADIRRECEAVQSSLILEQVERDAALLRGQLLSLDKVVAEMLEKDAAF